MIWRNIGGKFNSFFLWLMSLEYFLWGLTWWFFCILIELVAFIYTNIYSLTKVEIFHFYQIFRFWPGNRVNDQRRSKQKRLVFVCLSSDCCNIMFSHVNKLPFLCACQWWLGLLRFCYRSPTCWRPSSPLCISLPLKSCGFDWGA